MHRKVMVACVGVAALLVFARLIGSARASGSAGAGHPAASGSAIAQLAALPAEAAQVAVGRSAATIANNKNKATPAAAPQAALDLLASFSAADAIATARAAESPALKPGAAAATPSPFGMGQKSGAAAAINSAASGGSPATAGSPDAPKALNDVPLDAVVVLSPAALEHARQIYAFGQAQGRNPRAFSKIGDSTMAFPPLLSVFDNPATYRLGPFAYLSQAIERFAGSLGRESAAVKKGMHTWTEFDPTWVNSTQCQSGEGPLACELRLNNPSIVLIRLGANDYDEPKTFRESLQNIVEYCLARGVIPVLGTKPDRLEGAQNTINQIVYQVADDYALPLWDYDRIAASVPGKGLMSDGVHFLNNGSRDYSAKAAFTTADSLEDLTALMMLDTLSRQLPASRQ